MMAFMFRCWCWCQPGPLRASPVGWEWVWGCNGPPLSRPLNLSQGGESQALHLLGDGLCSHLRAEGRIAPTPKS